MKKTAVASAASPVEEVEARLCSCGCEQVVGPMRSFRPGHDQRHKGNLLRRADIGDKEAEAELLARGWRTETELVERAAKQAKKVTKTEGPDAGVEVKESTKEDAS